MEGTKLPLLTYLLTYLLQHTGFEMNRIWDVSNNTDIYSALQPKSHSGYDFSLQQDDF